MWLPFPKLPVLSPPSPLLDFLLRLCRFPCHFPPDGEILTVSLLRAQELQLWGLLGLLGWHRSLVLLGELVHVHNVASAGSEPLGPGSQSRSTFSEPSRGPHPGTVFRGLFDPHATYISFEAILLRAPLGGTLSYIPNPVLKFYFEKESW